MGDGPRPVGPGRWSGMPSWFREAVTRARAEHAARTSVHFPGRTFHTTRDATSAGVLADRIRNVEAAGGQFYSHHEDPDGDTYTTFVYPGTPSTAPWPEDAA